MRADLVDLLACPVCAGDLAGGGASLLCASGHRFDVARQGHVTLLHGGTPGGDTAEMVDARLRFLRAGHYDPITDALRGALVGIRGPILDVGAGPGHHLAAVLDGSSLDVDRIGLALDVSTAAARRAARAHPRMGAVVCDTWRPWPVRTGAASAVLTVFAPRNAAETARVLGPGGSLVVVTPTPAHLRELVSVLGLLTVDADKSERIAAQLAGFEPVSSVPVEFTMQLSVDAVAALVGMGPNAWHAGADRAARIAALPDPVRVTASVVVRRFAPVSV